jgi:hypothetical protein
MAFSSVSVVTNSLQLKRFGRSRTTEVTMASDVERIEEVAHG